MQASGDNHSWFGPSLSEAILGSHDGLLEFDRLWRGFMTARITLGLALLLLQGTLYGWGQVSNLGLLAVCSLYLAATLTTRLGLRPRRLGRNFDPLWVLTIGADVLVFALLQFFQGGSINYTPLFALPVLLASILGSLLLALGTAASVTLLLLAHESWLSFYFLGDVTPHFIQAAFAGAGIFAVALVAHQLSTRLANQEQQARRNESAARIQHQVNELVIESLTDGILVVDAHGTVHASNPAARHMLQADETAEMETPFRLAAHSGWRPLEHLTQLVFSEQRVRQVDINLQHAGQGPRHLRVRTRLTPSAKVGGESLCVMFLQDQREIEARMRTEKLASMGRMSLAVAHEIRNPLAAISQANELLDEDLQTPPHKQLTLIVQQNVRRLEKIVEDVLNIARVQKQAQSSAPPILELNDVLACVCEDWMGQTQSQHQLGLTLFPASLSVEFDLEHLRRLLINLLDNARRFATQNAGAIQVSSRVMTHGEVVLSVWSDSPPMEPTVVRHLFEPFFSSESRSSGLGLYICRELCSRHGASIAHQRSRCGPEEDAQEGNEFVVTLRAANVSRENSISQIPLFTPWQ